MMRRVAAALLLLHIATGLLYGRARALADVPAASAEIAIAGVEVGFEGRYKVGYWTPVRVLLENRSGAAVEGRLQLVVPDGDGAPSRVVSPDVVRLTPEQAKTIVLYAKFGRLESSMHFRFVHNGVVLAERDLQAGQGRAPFLVPPALPATDELIVTIGPAVGAEALVVAARRRARHAVAVVQLADRSSLPTAWYGYEGVDALIFSTSDPELFADFSPQDPQAVAIDRWIRLGGRAVISVGASAEQVLADGAFLGALAPGEFNRMLPLRSSAALEIYADTQTPLEATGRRFDLEAPQLTDIRGRVEAYEGGRPTDFPLVVRAAHGFGEVALIAVELDQPPLAAWPGRPALLNRLLGGPIDDVRRERSEAVGAVTTIGYGDLSGQLRSALDQFDGVTVVSFALVGGLAFVYLLLIGPFDYWVVKKLLGRTEATWVTFPLLAIGVSVGVYFAAYAIKGRELRTNEVELVDFDLDSGLVRGTLWANLFSPDPAGYDLALATQAPGEIAGQGEPEVLLSWLGLPGDALGGMQSGSNNPPLFNQPYDFAPGLDALRDVPVQIWSTKSFFARWHGQAPAPLEAELVATGDGMLRGRLVNRLGIELTDARLHYDRWVYPIPVFKDGQSVAVGDRLQPLTSHTLLTRQRTVQEKDLRDRTTAYDERSTDIPRILEMMMFHRLAGAERYTGGLTNRYQGFVDLSGHLALSRAVLVARGAAPTSTLTRDGKKMAGPHHQQITFYRFVIPVAPPP